jgi:hypothetical protein
MGLDSVKVALGSPLAQEVGAGFLLAQSARALEVGLARAQGGLLEGVDG